MKFEIVGTIEDIERGAAGLASACDPISARRMVEGVGEMKGTAAVRLPNGARRVVELHWYEAHGIGKKDFKIKRYLDTI